MAVAFVTMGVGVNARTAFSLLFPSILDEFGWERGMTAGAFSFGFLVSAVLTPCVGRLMDRRGPRVVIGMGVGLMATGLMLAPLIRQPWHLYATLGVLVSGGTNCLGYTGQSLFLPNWFVRRRGLAMSVAFSGVGVGSILVLPWLQALIGRAGWRAACWAMGILVLALLAPLNLLLKRRPEDLGLEPDGEPSLPSSAAGGPTANVVDAAWVAVDWTLGRMHTALLVDRRGLFLRLVRLLPCRCTRRNMIEIGFSATQAAWAELREPGPILARSPSAMCSYPGANGYGRWQPGLRAVTWPCSASATSRRQRCSPHGGLAVCSVMGNPSVIGAIPRDFPGHALRDDLRHADAGRHRGRSRRAVGDRRAA